MIVRRWFRPRTCAAMEASAAVREQSAAARRDANARFEEQNRRYECALGSPAIDWGPSMEAVARATAELGGTEEVHLPLEADKQPSPEAEQAARARDLRVLYPEQE